ncbi:hypothetical protein IEQ34_015389 [Dendrobium chrysotoxum]|uniref:Uncharacterized protein n=1 Tax=Dendrobium chrysotoxum TaxID=161865 RepID=A0AAV7GIM7_DENCH|nr:hypothetical protein IEQ34_015389 [Dendrobium chrysotoxum]
MRHRICHTSFTTINLPTRLLSQQRSKPSASEFTDEMLSTGAIYGHTIVQKDNIKEKIRRREGDFGQKTKENSKAKIHPTGSSLTERTVAGSFSVRRRRRRMRGDRVSFVPSCVYKWFCVFSLF